MAALARVVARITADADHAGVPAALAAGMAEEFGIALAAIFLYDPADDTLHLRASHGLRGAATHLISQIPARSANTAIVQRLTRGELVVLDPIGADGGFRDPAWLLRSGLRAYAGFPLLVGDRFVGVMSAFCRTSWPPLLLESLGVLAQQAALALEHARVLDESNVLQGVAAQLASARDMDALLDGIVHCSMSALGAEACAVWLLDGRTGSLVPAATRGLSPLFLQRIIGSSSNTSAFFSLLRDTRRPLFSPNAAVEAAPRDRALAEILADEGIVSALRLPLFEPGGDVIGMLGLYHRRERLYGESEVRLAQAFTDQVAVALHNARLAEREREARQAASRQVERLLTFSHITEQLLGTTDLDTVLRVVVESASRLCDASGAMVSLVDAERRHLIAATAHGTARSLYETEHGRTQPLDEGYYALSATGQAMRRREVVAVEDYTTWPASAARENTLATGIRAFVAAPLLAGGEVTGVLWVSDTKPRPFAPEDVSLIQALADQAALAIEHARLLRRAQDAAVLEERARLARDLHDSVTQSVFSLGMMARAAQTQYSRGSDTLGNTLDRIGTLAGEALAEMRALLYELRPASLAEEGLVAALEKLVAAVRLRSDVPITFRSECDSRLRAEAETAMFRIVQEALANAVRHAQATAITVALVEADGRLTATVTDDGVGFVPGAAAAATTGEHGTGLGMHTMRERAASAGLDLRVLSTLGEGTTVRVEASLTRNA
jgi:signal transduction histidine kinase